MKLRATEFFLQIVCPTVDEFDRHPGDVRRGVLACLVLQAMAEHFFRENKADLQAVDNCTKVNNFKLSLRRRDWGFGQVMDIANGVKHAKRAFDDLNHAAPAECGLAQCGFPLSTEPHVFIDEDQAWLLCQITEHVRDRWSERLGL